MGKTVHKQVNGRWLGLGAYCGNKDGWMGYYWREVNCKACLAYLPKWAKLKPPKPRVSRAFQVREP